MVLRIDCPGMYRDLCEEIVEQAEEPRISRREGLCYKVIRWEEEKCYEDRKITRG